MNDAVHLSPAPGASPPLHDREPPKKRGRSNAGCANCKKRKIKCDERRPGCLRCRTRRLACPGYSTEKFKWSCKHEVYHQQASSPEPGNPTGPRQTEPANSPLPRCYQWPGVSNDWSLNDVVSAGSWPSNLIHDETPLMDMFADDLGTLTRHQLPLLILSEAEATAATVPDSLSNDILQDEDKILRVFHDGSSTQFRPKPQHDYHPRDAESINLTESYSSNTRPSTLSQSSASGPSTIDNFTTSVPNSLLHVPTLLVEYYFRKVCRECSTFDSSYNPFRTKVCKMRFDSASLNYTIQSLAAAKLADELPNMKITGMEAQGQALESLKQDCLAVTALNEVSDAVLCTILLLGMTTSWHVPNDIGIEYLALAQRVITAKTQAHNTDTDLDFYHNALKYWTMIVSIVSGEELSDDPVRTTKISPPSLAFQFRGKVMPHPWTGVSPESQQVFGDTLRLIRRTRDMRSRAVPIYSKASINDMAQTITAAEQLEAKCWSVAVPPADDIIDTGDLDTPPSDHVLTAKAYLLSSIMHIYMMFPDVLESRMQSLDLEAVSAPSGLLHTLFASPGWPPRETGDSHGSLVRDMGLRIVEFLERIDVKSGTRVVHPPLLLSVASSLTLTRENEPDVNDQVQHCRSFIISRLETMHVLMKFRAIDNVLTVVKEVWRRLDTTGRDVFWMDVMYELRCETLYG